MKQSSGGLSEKEWMEELDAVRGNGRGRRKIEWTPDMDRVLLYARGQEPIVPWRAVESIFKKQGWPGSLNTLMKRLEDLKGTDNAQG